jgi:hypothetical protein
MARAAVAAVCAIVVAMAPGGCGGDDDDGGPGPPAAETRLLDALDSIGGGQAFTGTGYGWIDVRALAREANLDDELDWAARALGPGGEDLIRDGLARSELGVEPRRTRRLVSLSGSYVFGVRMDGVDSAAAERSLEQVGARAETNGEWTDLDLGAPASRPLDTELEELGALAARTAVSDDTVVISRTDGVRADLEGAGTPASEAPEARAAAACLGEVDAARIVPNNFTHLPNVGPDVLAFGVERKGNTTTEVLCPVDESAAEIEDAETALRDSFAADARDAVTGQELADVVDDAEVERLTTDGVEAVRARLELAPGAEPGFLFGAFVRGSLVTYIGLQGPLEDAG